MKVYLMIALAFIAGVVEGSASPIKTHGDFIGSFGVGLGLMCIAGFWSGRIARRIQ